MTVEYDTAKGIVSSALRFKSTVIPLVILRPEFFILLCINLSVTYAYKSGYFTPEEYHVDLSLKLTGVTGSLMTFFVVFYNGHVFNRYQRLYSLVKGMSENSLFAVTVLDRELGDKQFVRRLSRMLLASCFLFYFERTPVSGSVKDVDEVGAVSTEEWAQLKKLRLLEPREIHILKEQCRRSGAHAIPSFILLQWSMRIYRLKIARMNELDKAFFSVRECQEAIVQLLELPMPFQYYHIMNVMLLLNLVLWAYAMGLQQTYLANIIFAFVQLVFQGLRELSITLADPFGTDETDFPVNVWMTQLYHKIHCIVEDPWTPEVSAPCPGIGPLPLLHKSRCVLDLLIDTQQQPIASRRRFSLMFGNRRFSVYDVAPLAPMRSKPDQIPRLVTEKKGIDSEENAAENENDIRSNESDAMMGVAKESFFDDEDFLH